MAKPLTYLFRTLFVVGVFLPLHALGQSGSFSSYVDDQGAISFPEDFRTSMVHLGSWYVPEGGASGFHDVYTEKESALAYRDTGEFPDGATIVKELRAASSADYSTGANVSFASENLKQWFVMVKDAESRFDGNSIWGDGWGWALFTTDDQTTNAAADYKADCLGCHVPAADNDYIYIEAYPTLHN